MLDSVGGVQLPERFLGSPAVRSSTRISGGGSNPLHFYEVGAMPSYPLFIFSSTVWNPCLYALLNEQFRFAFVDLLQWIRRGSNRMKNRTFVASPTTARLVGLATRLGSDPLVSKDAKPHLKDLASTYEPERNGSIQNGYGGTTTNATLTELLSLKNDLYDMALPTDSFL